MQSRLLPEIDGKWQAHPANRWQEEFSIAKKLDLDLIEFIFDSPSAACNPLVSKEGINALSKIQDTHEIRVESICADYFMQNSLLDMNIAHKSISTLKMLIKNGKKLKGHKLLVPMKNKTITVTVSDFVFYDKKNERLNA